MLASKGKTNLYFLQRNVLCIHFEKKVLCTKAFYFPVSLVDSAQYGLCHHWFRTFSLSICYFSLLQQSSSRQPTSNSTYDHLQSYSKLFSSPYIFSKKWSVCKEGKGVMISNAVSFFGDNRFYFGHRYRNETIIKVEQVYHLVAFLFNLSSPLLQLSAYCKEMQKHTCHFPAIEQRNYARA